MAEVKAHEARRRTKLGSVVSNKMQKTVVVAVESVHRHKLYGRNVRRTHTFKAHDEQNACQVGDVVVIAESRPLSKEKHWVVREIVRETIGPGLELLAADPAIAQDPDAPAAPSAEEAEVAAEPVGEEASS